ncbi:MAG TPA: signal recognition particle-docking protein FtsY [Anaerolineae bacterium]|nr:signal recognition particle-docking protein FtsY [Anaerolineae bacterium]
MRERLISFKETLARTRKAAFGRIATLFGATEITPELWDELEAALIQADVGVATTQALLERLRERARHEGVVRADELQGRLKEELRAMLSLPSQPGTLAAARPAVVLVVGTNGSGKTTSIAKLAAYYKRAGHKVLLVAADTFRAAAGDQLDVWAGRVGVEVIGGQPGADPGSIAFDAMQAAQARGFDLALVDTAGRLHTKYNLMQELKKVRNVIAKAAPGAPHETYLVLDGTTGQNALAQARQFKEAVEVTGVLVTKLDGTAKGGMVFAVTHELGLPVRYLGTGEKLDDIVAFDAEAFVEGLFE